MTAPEPKDYGVPAGAMRPGDLGKLQNINGDSINWGQLTGITAAAEEARNGFVAGLRESIVKPLQQIFSGLRPPGWELVAEAFEDGQAALVVDMIRERIHDEAIAPVVQGITAALNGTAVSNLFDGIRSRYATDINGLNSSIGAVSSDVDAIRAEQLAMEERLRAEMALVGLSGYISATPSRSTSVKGGYASPVLFDAQNGAAKGAAIGGGAKQLALRKPGTWLVNGVIWVGSTSSPKGLLESDQTTFEIRATKYYPYYPFGDKTESYSVTANHDGTAQSIPFSFTVQVPEPDTSQPLDLQRTVLTFWATCARSRSIAGGMQWSSVTAILLNDEQGPQAPLVGV